MDARVQRVIDHIQSSPDFVCNPAKSALNRGVLLTPDALSPDERELPEKVHDVIRLLLTEPRMEGAMLVSADDPDSAKGVEGLLPTFRNIVLATKSGVQKVAGLEDVPSWKFLLEGHVIGKAKITWGIATTDPDDEGILITAHGPAYPLKHPRYQPHPTLAVIRMSVLKRITSAAVASIYERASTAAGRKYDTETFLLPLTSEWEF